MSLRRKKKNKHKQKYHSKVRAAGAATAIETAETPELKDACDFTLKIPQKVFEKVMYWIDKASPNEVSGFGSLDFDKETREFRVRDAILLKQEVSGGSTEIDDQAINKAMFEMRDEPGALKWHWHSHPTFGVFWSPTDMELIRQLGQRGWIVATVLNCKRESRTAFLTSVDVLGRPHDIFIDDFKTTVVRPVDVAAQKLYDAEFEAKVTESRWSKRTWEYTPKSPHVYTPPEIYTPPRLPSGRNKVKPEDYDRYGYAEYDGQTIYNPIYDSSLVGKLQQFGMIDEMKDEEITLLKDIDADFAGLWRDYVIAKANEENYHRGE